MVAARAQSRELSDTLLRRSGSRWFTSTLLLDEDEGSRAVAALVPGLDVAQVISLIDDPATEAAYQADRAETRSAEQRGRPAIAQGRTADVRRPERFTAPSIVFRAADRSLVAGGWQPLGAYDVCIANLEPALPRRAAATVAEALAAFPAGLTTAELPASAPSTTTTRSAWGVTSEVVDAVRAVRRCASRSASAELWRPA